MHHPLEADLPDIGRAVLAEGEQQIEVDLSARGLRRRFADGFAGRRLTAQRFSLHHAIATLSVSTEVDVAEQLREQLGRRLARRRAA